MPAKELIGKGKLTESMLPPHMRKKRAGGVSVASILNETKMTVVLAEDIDAGIAVNIATDGLGYIASVHASNDKPATAITIVPGTSGQKVQIKSISELPVSIPDANFTKGNTVWLGANGTLTTDAPAFNSGDRTQRLGVAYSSSEVILKIETSRTIR